MGDCPFRMIAYANEPAEHACSEIECEWWNGDVNACSVWVMAVNLEGIQAELSSITHETRSQDNGGVGTE